METLLVVIHYMICFFLIIVILLQAGKGADIGAVFGGASQTVFGSRGPTTFLNRITAGVAIAFLATSIWLAHISKNRSATSVIDKAPISQTAQPPAGAPAETTGTAPANEAPVEAPAAPAPAPAK